VRRFVIAALSLAVLAGLPAPVSPPPASAQEAVDGRYQDFGDPGGFLNIVPPGQKGTVNGPEALRFQADGTYPEHFNDQTGLYDGLLDVAGLPAPGPAPAGVTDADLGDYFKDASFGTDRPGRSYAPTSGLRIVRDAEFGVPHIFGETRAAAMFGAGYAGAEDRLFLMDALRHLGRGRVSEFLGASEGNRAMDRDQLRVAPYTEEELTQQVADICAMGTEGRRACDDLDAYTDGVNAFIAEARQDPSKLPAEYPALQQQPRDWAPEDTVAIASLVGGIFGRGGGNEVASGQFLAQLQAEHGEVDGRRIWADFRSANDPEAPHTTQRAFPYNNHTDVDPASTAILDLETVEAAMEQMAPAPRVLDGPFGPIDLTTPSGNSNALLVTGEHTDDGRPIAVFGPQTGYFTPQLLVEMDIHGPGISARGVAFAGTNIYVQLGRGRDYAWSATSASADNVDQWVLELCDPGGGEPGEDAQHYVRNGACTPMDVYTHRQIAKPTGAGVCTQPSPECLVYEEEIERSVYGPVIARGTVDGKPVAVAEQRSTYGAELVSAIGFQRINDPDYMRDGARSFMTAFDGVEYTFNWFYVDEEDIAYKHSCRCPIRNPRTDPDLPTWGTGQWDWTGQWLRPADQPQEINPASGHFSNWNNKQAPQFRANDGQYSYSSTYRSEFLRVRIADAIRRGELVSRADVVNMAMDAATVDLNGQEIYPLALRILGTSAPGGDATLQAMRDRLAEWVRAGGHRRDVSGDGEYDHAVAVAIGDATLRPMLDAVFGDVLDGADLPQREEDSPRLGLGSAYNGGQANFLHKDFRQVLGEPVTGARSRTYCGGGNLVACRAALWDALAQAAADLADEYESDSVDDWVYDAARDEIIQSAVGLVPAPNLRWQNRPTFQQVVQVGGPRRPAIERVAGERRFETAVAVSRTRFEEAGTVVLARADRYPDALAGAPLAAQLEAPLLLTASDALHEATADEIARLGAGEAVLLGGEDAISRRVEAELLLRGVRSRRVAGDDRFATAAAVAEELGDADGAFLVEGGHPDPGRGWPDALAAAPYAAFTARPILLTNAGELPGPTADALEGLGIRETLVVGGPRAVSDAVVAEVRAAGHGPRRIAGDDRYGTGVAVWREAVSAGMDGGELWLATGLSFPDALAAGPTVAAHGHSLLLVHGTDLARSPATQALLRAEAEALQTVRLLGGPAAISASVARAIIAEVR
jgi:acyl-homoserine lactone acylase PvdQ